MKNPKLSVIIPAYNVEKYIIRSVNSGLSQNNLDVEVVVIDDGSTDHTFDMVNCTFKNEKVRCFKQDNKGLYRTRCEGIRRAKGEFLTFIDADDYIENNFYSLLVDRMEKENIDILEFGYCRVSEDGKIISSNAFFEEYKDLPLAIKKIINKSNCMCSMCNKIYRRKLFDVSVLENLNAKKYEEDTLTNLIAFEKAKFFLTISDIGYYYTVRENSITTSKICYKEDDYLISWKLIYERYHNSFFGNVVSIGFCSRIAYAYCMARLNKYDHNELRKLKLLFYAVYKDNNLKKYKYEFESTNRKTMVKLFRVSPTLCYLLFLIRKKIAK